MVVVLFILFMLIYIPVVGMFHFLGGSLKEMDKFTEKHQKKREEEKRRAKLRRDIESSVKWHGR